MSAYDEMRSHALHAINCVNAMHPHANLKLNEADDAGWRRATRALTFLADGDDVMWSNLHPKLAEYALRAALDLADYAGSELGQLGLRASARLLAMQGEPLPLREAAALLQLNLGTVRTYASRGGRLHGGLVYKRKTPYLQAETVLAYEKESRK